MDSQHVAATLTAAIIQTSGKDAVAAALSDRAEERVRVARQTVVLYETILGMLPRATQGQRAA